MLVFSTPCPGDGATVLPFGAAAGSGWDGSCNQENTLPANELCDGALCAQSLLLPATTAAPCAPSVPVASKPDWTWGRRVRQCRPLQQACGAGQVCVPRAVPGGFDLCRYVAGDTGCPPGYYSEPSLFYMGATDERACEACDCASPEGAQCEAYVSVYKDGACASPIAQHLVADAPLCVDVVAGSALGSSAAVMLTDVAGSCAPSGGEPVGGLEPAGPVTLCCPKVPK